MIANEATLSQRQTYSIGYSYRSTYTRPSIRIQTQAVYMAIDENMLKKVKKFKREN